MKIIYLVRHAKSSWKYPDLDDFERPLNKRGLKSAPVMGKVLKKLKVTPQLVLSSPANRAAMTARIIAIAIDYPIENIQYSETLYQYSQNSLIRVVKQIDDAVNQVMLVGHNPGINGLTNYISDQPVYNIPTCGAICVELDIASWPKLCEHCGKLKFFEFPKKYTA